MASAGTSGELDRQAIGSGLEAAHHTVHEPRDSDADGPADPAKKDGLPPRACHEDASLLGNEALLGVQDKRPAAALALMGLLAGVHTPVPLELHRAAP
jgi:hypothetical protein